MVNWRAWSDWRQSPAHIFLLSKFLTPRARETITTGAWVEQWQGALNEEPAVALDRFLKERFLRQATTTEAMEIFTVARLKDALRDRHAPVSGRKSELIERLFALDPAACSEWTRDLCMYQCSDLGAPIADAYVKDRTERRVQAERASQDAFTNRDVDSAVRVMREFEDTEIFERYLFAGVSDQPVSALVDQMVADQVSLLLTLHPGILRDVHQGELESLRVAAGMMALWGTGDAKRWLPEGFQNGCHLSNDAAARMLVFAASHQRKLQQLREAGFPRVKVLGAKDDHHCESCASLAQVYSIDGVPELPNPSCTCSIGCRCVVVADGNEFAPQHPP